MVLPFSPNLLIRTTGRKPFSQSYTTSSRRTSAGISHPFTSISVGPAASEKLIVVASIYAVSGNTDYSLITLDGNAMTIIGQNDGQNSGSAMAYRRISGSLTEVDITLNFGASVARSEIHVYTIEGAKNDTPYDAHFPAGGGGGSRSATLDIPAGGGAIAVAYDGGSGSWTNATENFQLDESSCASQMTDTPLSSYVIGCGSSVRTIGAVSWR